MQILYITTFKYKHANTLLCSFKHYIFSSLTMAIVFANSSFVNVYHKENILEYSVRRQVLGHNSCDQNRCTRTSYFFSPSAK